MSGIVYSLLAALMACVYLVALGVAIVIAALVLGCAKAAWWARHWFRWMFYLDKEHGP